jgi:(E)-4-hydroxy-3-methyl-but-2-enyl pyrophosphate reductase
MGVHRAMDMVLTEANRGQGPIFTYGPLIHNRQVMELLESKGVKVVKEVSGLEKGTLVIRAHGISPDQRRLLKSTGLRLIDATCPRVAKVQSIIRSHTRKGYTAVIVGDRDHPEVIGLMGYGNGRVHLITRPNEVADLPHMDKVFLVAQTTQEEQNYRDIAEAVKKRFPGAVVFETICDATHSRQAEVKSFAGLVDGMVVVGGYHSGNTRRLAQVSEAAGLSTFHVETDDELDKEKLSAMEVVGVTAGASTPNWMIKKVVQKIEAIRGRGETLLSRWIRLAFKSLFISNVVVAFGAFSLTHAATILMGREPDRIHPSLVMLYIYGMHVLNRFLDKGASTYNDPAMANFYRKYRVLLILTGIAAIAGSLMLASRLGHTVFIAMVGLNALGIIYGVPVIPRGRRHRWRYAKIKDVPGSKTLSEALAWAAVITLVPLLEPDRAAWANTACTFTFVFTMVYVRSALFDIFQAQGDLIVGVETLPITLGERRTLQLLKGIILLGALILLATPFFTTVGPFSYLLLLCFLSLILSLLTYEKRWLYPGTRLEAIVEANFFLAGLLGLLWHLLS